MSSKDVRTTSSPARSGGGSSRPLMMKRLPSTGRPKRGSFFPCAACGKIFPTQQAMAGHSSTHGHSPPPLPVVVVDHPVHESRAGVQRRIAGMYQYHGRWPPVAVPRLPYLPLVPRRHHHMINHQPPRWAPPCVQQLLELNTPPPHQMPDATHTTAAAHQIQATQFGWGALFPRHTLLQLDSRSVPVQSHASSTTNQQQVQVDLTLHLGLGTGRRVAGDAGGKKAAVMMHDGDRGDKDLDGVDLELLLCR